MSSNGLYIGIPNGAVLCIDEFTDHGIFKGRLYHHFHDGPVAVGSFLDMTRRLEDLFDEMQFPRPGLKMRSFQQKQAAPAQREKEREIIMSDKELLTQHGDLGTFIIRVQQRQSGTWQGRVTWADQNKTVHFRSILELIKLIESGIIAEHPELEAEKQPDWED